MKNFKINQALVCIDLSDIDNVVLDYLNYMNPKLKIGSMNFLHVVRRPGFLSAIFDSNKDAIHSEFVLNEDILKQLVDNVESKIVDLEGTHTEYEIEEGNPLNHILASIKEHHADLLVIGKKSGDESSGNLGKSLARHSSASILSIPSKAKNKLDNILVPVDFSENSGKALQTAIQLNYQLESTAKISCVHIFEMPDLSYYKINKTYEQLKDIIEADMQYAFDKFIEKYAPNMGDMLVKKSFLRKELSTAGQLISLCTDYNADLVVMGAKGHSALNSIFIGSVTEKFIQMNDFVPTLLVRST
jgi:nucleotide-binding universal stress UspA family protein